MSGLLLFGVSQDKARLGEGPERVSSFRVETDAVRWVVHVVSWLAFDPVGTGVARVWHGV